MWTSIQAFTIGHLFQYSKDFTLELISNMEDYLNGVIDFSPIEDVMNITESHGKINTIHLNHFQKRIPMKNYLTFDTHLKIDGFVSDNPESQINFDNTAYLQSKKIRMHNADNNIFNSIIIRRKQ